MGSKKIYRKYAMLIVLLILLIGLSGIMLSRDRKENSQSKGEEAEATEQTEQWEKGYNLPLDTQKKKDAEEECSAAMELISSQYQNMDKGDASDGVLSDEEIVALKEVLKEDRLTVTGADAYSTMENYETMEDFLADCKEGKEGTTVLYKVKSSGGLNRMEFEYDGENLYVVDTISEWSGDGEPVISSTSYTRVKWWNYTEKGWLSYELCAPQPPEVTEVVDASTMIRIRPMEETYRELSRKCVLALGYQGNNLLCSNWNTSDLSRLDYNGVFESFYEMKYGTIIDYDRYADGIEAEEFESLIMEYLPVTKDELRACAEYDAETGTYLWVRLGTGNYSPTTFGTSIPEVVKAEEKGDGIVELTVQAVCMAACNDNAMTHKLIVQFSDDGTFQYLGNEISEEELAKVPEYQYRLGKQWEEADEE